jgi:perosamine synthetase
MSTFNVAKPYIDASDISAVTNVLKSGSLSLGPKYKEFEKGVAKFVSAKYACAVSSGTAGLHLVVKSLGLDEGDEVITSPFSFISSSNCLLYERLKPVFVDIEETTFNMDPEKIERTITKKTRAILVVHIFGQPSDMDPIMRIAKKHHLKVIEDSCESLGSLYKNKMSGTLGDAGVYAFYPNKQMTTGEGGMIVTNKRKIYELCDSLRNQGRKNSSDWLTHVRMGYNYRMDEMSAALGISQLSKLRWMIAKKSHVANLYTKYLHDVPFVITPAIGFNRTHSWFVYVIRITNGKRNFVMDRLMKAGIQTKPYLPVIHLQPFMKKLFNYRRGDFPIAEKISTQTLALPFYSILEKHDIRTICSKIRKFL